jgi:hypothetical protein
VTHTVLLDNEAVQALLDPAHRKHRRALAHVQVVAERKRKAQPIALAVPTTIRVEAGWDRRARTSAFVNRLRIGDLPLDRQAADAAASLRRQHHVSVADAHVGASATDAAASGRVTVLTSDPDDVRRMVGDAAVTIVRL